MLRTAILLSLLLTVARAAPAFARKSAPGPDGLPSTDPKHPWKMFTGSPRVDTLSYTPTEILPAARRQFENDKWEVFILDPARGTIVTRWKPMSHPLLLLFMGHVRARCTVTMRPLSPHRTRLVFRGDLASHRSLEGNPMLGAAKSAYAKAAQDYVSEVRDYLMAHPRLSSLP